MVISIVFFTSFFTYLQFIDNKFKKEKTTTPFIFAIVLLAIWELLVIVFYGEGISYEILNYLFLLTYSLVIFIFLCLFTKNILKYWNRRKVFKSALFYLPFFCSLLFLCIVLLYYHKNLEPVETDQLYYQYIMNYFHRKGSYIIPPNINEPLLLYSNIGLYQFGASFGFQENMMLMPYLTMFLFFYGIFTSIFFIFDKFITKDTIKLISYLFFFILTIVFYVFFSFQNKWTILVGNYETAFLLLIFLIPSFLKIKKLTHQQNFLLFFAYLFLNETSIMVLPIFIIPYISIFLSRKNRREFSIDLFFAYISLFLFSLYLLVCDLLFVRIGYIESHLLFKFIPLSFGILFFVSIFLIAFWKYKFKYLSHLKIIYNVTMKIDSYWNQSDLFSLWFNNRKNFIKNIMNIIFFSITVIFIFLTLLYIDFPVKGWLFESTFFGIMLSLLFLKIIIFNKKDTINSFALYFIWLMILSFLVGLILTGNNIDSNITDRFFYTTIYLNKGSSSIAKDFVFLIALSYIAFNPLKKIFPAWKIHTFANYKKWGIVAGISLYTLGSLSYVASLTFQEIGISGYLTFQSIDNNFFGSISKNTWKILQTYDFNEKLVFSDIPLPIINSTANTIIKHSVYGEYWNLLYFYSNWKDFRNLEGKSLSTKNSNNLKKFFFPYFEYVVLRTQDKFALQILYSMRAYKEIDSINNQIIIFKNYDVDLSGQKQFLLENNSTF